MCQYAIAFSTRNVFLSKIYASHQNKGFFQKDTGDTALRAEMFASCQVHAVRKFVAGYAPASL